MLSYQILADFERTSGLKLIMVEQRLKYLLESTGKMFKKSVKMIKHFNEKHFEKITYHKCVYHIVLTDSEFQ